MPDLWTSFTESTARFKPSSPVRRPSGRLRTCCVMSRAGQTSSASSHSASA